jgi:hypothetical protein
MSKMAALSRQGDTRAPNWVDQGSDPTVWSINRDDRIRTCGPFVPNEVRYQAAPHPDGPTLRDRMIASQAPLSEGKDGSQARPLACLESFFPQGTAWGTVLVAFYPLPRLHGFGRSQTALVTC